MFSEGNPNNSNLLTLDYGQEWEMSTLLSGGGEEWMGLALSNFAILVRSVLVETGSKQASGFWEI